jgi:hypothetical protein
MFWRSLLENEQMQTELDQQAKVNYSALKRIYHLEEYYENNLIPRLFSFPTQYLNRVQQLQKQHQEKDSQDHSAKISGRHMLPVPSDTMIKDAHDECPQSQEFNSQDGIHQIETPQKETTLLDDQEEEKVEMPRANNDK